MHSTPASLVGGFYVGRRVRKAVERALDEAEVENPFVRFVVKYGAGFVAHTATAAAVNVAMGDPVSLVTATPVGGCLDGLLDAFELV